jgi:hypothetical protein
MRSLVRTADEVPVVLGRKRSDEIVV